MSDLQNTVFISYRRNVSKYVARAIFQDLRQHGYNVFLDVETIDSGAFDTAILNQIAARAHFVVILTAGTLERCAEPNDWLRQEIEYAMVSQRNVVPVLMDEFTFDDGAKKHLTGKLESLPRYNALRLHYDYFDEGMERLRNRYLKQPTHGVITPISPIEQKQAEQKIEELANAPQPTQNELTAEQLFGLARVREEMGNLDGAFDSYTEAISVNPNYADAYNNRGNVRNYRGDLHGAISDYNEVIRIDPTDPIAWNNRAETHFQLGQYEKALLDFEKADDLRPDYPMTVGGQAVTHHALGNLNKAKRLWKSLLANDERYRDVDWVRVKLNWDAPLVEEARKLIPSLDD